MATKSPARNYWEIPFLEGLYWTGIGALRPETAYNTYEMVVSGKGNPAIGNAERYRIAMKFSTVSAPAWVSDGDAVEQNCLLFVYLGEDSSETPDGIQVAQVTAGAWDEDSNWATMEGLTLGPFSASLEPVPSASINGWVAFQIPNTSAWMQNALGLVFKINNTGTGLDCYKILKDPAPVVRAYYRYPLDNTIETDATARGTITSALRERVKSPASGFTISSSIVQADVSPSLLDLAVDISAEGLAIFNQEINMETPWAPSLSGRGTAIFPPGTPDLYDYEGYFLELTQTMRYRQEPPVVIRRAQALLGEINMVPDGGQEVALEDPLISAMNRYPHYRHSLEGPEGVNYDDEPLIWVLADLLVNAGAIPWEKFRQADLVWLFRRFGTVWSRFTIAEADLDDYTVGAFLEAYAQMFSLFMGQASDGTISIFHPSAYRPSLAVHEYNLRKASDVSRVRRRAYDQYAMVTVDTLEVPAETPLPTKYDRIDASYDIDGALLWGHLDSQKEAKMGLGRALLRYLGGARDVLTFTGSGECMLWEVGDQVNITSEDYGYDGETFLVMAAPFNPVEGQLQTAVLVRFTDDEAMHSTFQNTQLEGLWTWWDWYSDAADKSSQDWEGGDGGTWTGTVGTSGQVYVSWQGGLFDVDVSLLSADGFPPTDSAGTCDMVDFIYGVNGDQDTDPYTITKDNEYVQCFSFRNGVDNKALIFGIHRLDEDANPGVQAHAVDNALFLGYTTNYTATTTVWTNYVETSKGLSIGGSGAGWRAYGIGIQWLDDEVYFYVNRELIGSFSMDKTLFDRAAINTETATEQMMGPMRWLKRTDGELFPVSRMYGRNGTDPFYP